MNSIFEDRCCSVSAACRCCHLLLGVSSAVASSLTDWALLSLQAELHPDPALFVACSLATACCFCKAVTCRLVSTGNTWLSQAAPCYLFKELVLNGFIPVWRTSFCRDAVTCWHTEAPSVRPLYVLQIHLWLHIIAASRFLCSVISH